MAKFLDRGIEQRLRSRFERDSVVILEGARATGKTSILTKAVEAGWVREIRTFMDRAELAAATEGPNAYIDSLPAGTAIDEAQLAEEVTLAIKARIDRDSRPGQLILTGSTRLRRNALGGSDPLAGRVNAPLVLRPMTLGERRGQPGGLVESLLDDDPMSIPLGPRFSRTNLVQVVTQTGLPGLLDITAGERDQRASAYLTSVTALEAFESRNVHNLGSLARFLGGRTSTLVNVNQFSQAVEIARATVDEYLAHLEEALLIHRLPGWRPTKDKSETDKAKIHFFDVGIAASLARLDPQRTPDDLGRLAETLVVTEFLSQAEWMDEPPALYHWRHKGKDEVDLVLEAQDGRVLCVEVKSAESVDRSDFKGIEAFSERYPDRFHRGLVFYTGTNVLPFGDDLWAIPFAALRPEAQAQDPVAPTIQSIAARRAERTAELDKLDSRIESFVQAIESSLTSLGESISADYQSKVSSGNPARVWDSGLAIDVDGQQHYLVNTRLDLARNVLTATVPRQGTDKLHRVDVMIDARSAVEIVGELFAKSENHLLTRLSFWDDQRRTGPAA